MEKITTIKGRVVLINVDCVTAIIPQYEKYNRETKVWDDVVGQGSIVLFGGTEIRVSCDEAQRIATLLS